MSFSTEQVQHAILFLIAFILSTTFHEFGHAWVANKLGDRLPQAEGRLTLSPLHHIDPIGTILLPIIMGLQTSGGPLIAWGKPVRTNPSAYTRRFSMSTGSVLVAIAGPIMNLVMATIVSLLVVIGMRTGLMNITVAQGLIEYMVLLNLSLMFFNLLPIPPLDGGTLLAWLLPRSMHPVVDFLEKWGSLVLLGLLLTGLIGRLMYPATIVMRFWLHGLAVIAG